MSWAEHLNINIVAVLSAAAVAWVLGRDLVHPAQQALARGGGRYPPGVQGQGSGRSSGVPVRGVVPGRGGDGAVHRRPAGPPGPGDGQARSRTGLWLLGRPFVATTTTVNNAYPGRKVSLTLIDAGHWLMVLIAEGVVIGVFGTFGW